MRSFSGLCGAILTVGSEGMKPSVLTCVQASTLWEEEVTICVKKALNVS